MAKQPILRGMYLTGMYYYPKAIKRDPVHFMMYIDRVQKAGTGYTFQGHSKELDGGVPGKIQMTGSYISHRIKFDLRYPATHAKNKDGETVRIGNWPYTIHFEGMMTAVDDLHGMWYRRNNQSISGRWVGSMIDLWRTGRKFSK